MGVCSLAGVWQAQHELTDGKFAAMQFHAEPAVGVLEAGAAADITLTFAPDSLHRQEARHTSPLTCSHIIPHALLIRPAPLLA